MGQNNFIQSGKTKSTPTETSDERWYDSIIITIIIIITFTYQMCGGLVEDKEAMNASSSMFW